MRTAADVGKAGVGNARALVCQLSLKGRRAEISLGLRVAEVGERAEASPKTWQKRVLLLVAHFETPNARAARILHLAERVAGKLPLETVVGAAHERRVNRARVIRDFLQKYADLEEPDRLKIFLHGHFEIIRGVGPQIRISGGDDPCLFVDVGGRE